MKNIRFKKESCIKHNLQTNDPKNINYGRVSSDLEKKV